MPQKCRCLINLTNKKAPPLIFSFWCEWLSDKEALMALVRERETDKEKEKALKPEQAKRTIG